jgi:hypothetical protein
MKMLVEQAVAATKDRKAPIGGKIQKNSGAGKGCGKKP